MILFSERLQKLASDKKIYQADLAASLKKDRATVSKWWNGDIVPGPKNMRLIADYFGCNIDWLADGKGEPYPEPKKGYIAPQPGVVTFRRRAEDHEPKPKTVRMYRELAQMDADTFGEIQTWLNDMEKTRPGYTSWFRLEFENRFPEFEEWKQQVLKKQANGGDC